MLIADQPGPMAYSITHIRSSVEANRLISFLEAGNRSRRGRERERKAGQSGDVELHVGQKTTCCCCYLKSQEEKRVNVLLRRVSSEVVMGYVNHRIVKSRHGIFIGSLSRSIPVVSSSLSYAMLFKLVSSKCSAVADRQVSSHLILK